MKQLVRVGDQQYIIEIPTTFGADRNFTASIGDRRFNMRWHPQLGTLSVTDNGHTFNLKARSSKFERLPDESETTVKLEWYDPLSSSMKTADFQIDNHVPGAANRRAASANASKHVRSPMTGKILSISVSNGDSVNKGDLLMIIEAMKMENKIVATTNGEVQGLQVNAGQTVSVGAELCCIKAHDPH